MASDLMRAGPGWPGFGRHVRVRDGRVGTVVFNGLVGIGIKWGLWNPPRKAFEGTSGGVGQETRPDNWPWQPEAWLREWLHSSDLECVGEEFEFVDDAEEEHDGD